MMFSYESKDDPASSSKIYFRWWSTIWGSNEPHCSLGRRQISNSLENEFCFRNLKFGHRIPRESWVFNYISSFWKLSFFTWYVLKLTLEFGLGFLKSSCLNQTEEKVLSGHLHIINSKFHIIIKYEESLASQIIYLEK